MMKAAKKINFYFTVEGFQKLEDELKNKRAIGGSIDELLRLYRNAVIIEETEEYKNWDATTVSRKCEVDLEIDGEVERYTILGHGESNVLENVVSCEAPIAIKLLGKKTGDAIEFNGMKIVIKGVSKVQEVQKVKTLK